MASARLGFWLSLPPPSCPLKGQMRLKESCLLLGAHLWPLSRLLPCQWTLHLLSQILPPGLCTCCSLLLSAPSPSLRGWLLPRLSFSQGLPPQGGPPRPTCLQWPHICSVSLARLFPSWLVLLPKIALKKKSFLGGIILDTQKSCKDCTQGFCRCFTQFS